MASDLTCKNKHILFKPFDEEYILHQRLEANVLSPRASACYTPIQDLESKQLLKDVLGSNDVKKHLERFAASVVYTTTFGMRIITGEEWQIQTSYECLDNFVNAGTVGVWIVDIFPFLNVLPAALAPWKRTAEGWYKQWDNLHMANYRDALKREGLNWTKDFVNAKEAQQMSVEDVAWDLGVLCDAGVETTSAQLEVFILACLAHPEWIPHAQKELDDIVGHTRMPDFEDFEKLPYIRAVVEEAFRWRHILPTGVPHATDRDDYYNGYLIPKGSIIVPLFMAMREDERLFESPADFLPERWIGKSQAGNFGYGRRICPGRFIARNSLTIVIARLLWGFNIRPKDGKRLVLDESMFTTDFVSKPRSIDAVFEPRTEGHRTVIESAYEAVDKDVVRLLAEVEKRQASAGVKRRA
jgi:cytochrome P450